MISYRIQSSKIMEGIYIPKYYDPNIKKRLLLLAKTHDCYRINDLVNAGIIDLQTGHEIGKESYGTGNIPFVRTSDISNWEIKAYPKQGVSEEIYNEYSVRQDVTEGDILLVRDGTYLIGNNCFITLIDKDILYQSHILRIRINNTVKIHPILFFLSLNSDIVQQQIRSKQFTADIIDTIGNRFLEVIIPIPKNKSLKHKLIKQANRMLAIREKGKAFIKHCSKLVEDSLAKNSIEPIDNFLSLSEDDIVKTLSSETVTSEFGKFEAFSIRSDDIVHDIYLPKYYDPSINAELKTLMKFCDIISCGSLKEEGLIDYHTGIEIGKMAYGTGNIPFIRTSDFSNWEIKHNPKHCIAEDIYDIYKEKQDVDALDILLVRDGTYLVGSSCIITEADKKSLFCGGLYKIRVLNSDGFTSYTLLALLNSYIVKRQIRTKQFTRDVIDTIGHRINEVYLPIPKSKKLKAAFNGAIESVINSRIDARKGISKLAKDIIKG